MSLSLTWKFPARVNQAQGLLLQMRHQFHHHCLPRDGGEVWRLSAVDAEFCCGFHNLTVRIGLRNSDAIQARPV